MSDDAGNSWQNKTGKLDFKSFPNDYHVLLQRLTENATELREHTKKLKKLFPDGMNPTHRADPFIIADCDIIKAISNASTLQVLGRKVPKNKDTVITMLRVADAFVEEFTEEIKRLNSESGFMAPENLEGLSSEQQAAINTFSEQCDETVDTYLARLSSDIKAEIEKFKGQEREGQNPV